MEFNGAKEEEPIFDIEKYVLMGEITKDTSLGRWSVGYYPSGEGWRVVYTEATTERHTHSTTKGYALEMYERISNEYREVARRVMEHRHPGMFISNIVKREQYYKYVMEYRGEIRKREKTQKEQEAKVRAQKAEEAYKRRATSYADYVLYYCDKIGPAQKTRIDYVWLSADGYAVFEGKYAHEYDAYLICGKITNIKDYFAEIKDLMHKYIDAKEGHSMYDRDRKNPEIQAGTRKLAGYIRREVNIDTLRYEDVVSMYDEAFKNHEFPDEYGKRELMKQMIDYNDYMNKTHGGF